MGFCWRILGLGELFFIKLWEWLRGANDMLGARNAEP